MTKCDTHLTLFKSAHRKTKTHYAFKRFDKEQLEVESRYPMKSAHTHLVLVPLNVPADSLGSPQLGSRCLADAVAPAHSARLHRAYPTAFGFPASSPVQ